jgi:hypothetical protein
MAAGTSAPAPEAAAPCWMVGPAVPGAVTHVVAGSFRQPGSVDAALVSAGHVQLLADAGRRRMALACTQPLHAPVADAKALPCPAIGQVGREISLWRCMHAVHIQLCALRCTPD